MLFYVLCALLFLALFCCVLGVILTQEGAMCEHDMVLQEDNTIDHYCVYVCSVCGHVEVISYPAPDVNEEEDDD